MKPSANNASTVVKSQDKNVSGDNAWSADNVNFDVDSGNADEPSYDECNASVASTFEKDADDVESDEPNTFI